MEATKKHIERIVEQYIKQFSEEYRIFQRAMDMKRSMTRDEYASVDGSDEMRGILEMPETLSTMLIMDLNEEETEWFTTKAGARWFARKFPAFKLPDVI